jgi:hypothetical protein
MQRAAAGVEDCPIETTADEIEKVGDDHDPDGVARLNHDETANRAAPHHIRRLTNGHCWFDRDSGRSHEVGNDAGRPDGRTSTPACITIRQDADDPSALGDDEMIMRLKRIVFQASSAIAVGAIVFTSSVITSFTRITVSRSQRVSACSSCEETASRVPPRRVDETFRAGWNAAPRTGTAGIARRPPRRDWERSCPLPFAYRVRL